MRNVVFSAVWALVVDAAVGGSLEVHLVPGAVRGFRCERIRTTRRVRHGEELIARTRVVLDWSLKVVEKDQDGTLTVLVNLLDRTEYSTALKPDGSVREPEKPLEIDWRASAEALRRRNNVRRLGKGLPPRETVERESPAGEVDLLTMMRGVNVWVRVSSQGTVQRVATTREGLNNEDALQEFRRQREGVEGMVGFRVWERAKTVLPIVFSACVHAGELEVAAEYRDPPPRPTFVRREGQSPRGRMIEAGGMMVGNASPYAYAYTGGDTAAGVEVAAFALSLKTRDGEKKAGTGRALFSKNDGLLYSLEWSTPAATGQSGETIRRISVP